MNALAMPLCPPGVPLGRLPLWGSWDWSVSVGRGPAAGGGWGGERPAAWPLTRARVLPGNLLSSLMGSSEQEGEDSQDDSSPIELD